MLRAAQECTINMAGRPQEAVYYKGIAVLAEHLRALADTTQTELVPLNRHIFTHTPPIPGFREQQQVGTGRKRGQRARQ